MPNVSQTATQSLVQGQLRCLRVSDVPLTLEKGVANGTPLVMTSVRGQGFLFLNARVTV
jgi:hypothetical protein